MRIFPSILLMSLVALNASTSLADESSASSARSDAYDDESESRRPVFDEEAPVAPDINKAPLEAGGLAAPRHFELGESKSDIEKDLEKADLKDTDRGLELAYIAGDIGIQWLSFRAPARRVNQSGISFSLAAGVRLLYFTVGGRVISTQTKDFYSYSATPEVGFKLPFGAFEPHFLVGLGYTRVGKMNEDLLGIPPGQVNKASIDGLNLRAGAGFDYFLSPTFSVGTLVSGDWLRFLRAPQVSGKELATDSSGAQLRASFVLALHI